MRSFITQFGRKFSLAMIALMLGFVISAVSLALVVAYPETAMNVLAVVTQFTLVISVAVGAFSGANAVVEWRHGTTGVGKPEPRPSGTITEPQ